MNDKRASTPASQEDPRPERGHVRLAVALALLFATVAGIALGIRGLAAAGTNPTISVSPASQNQIWYKPAPITITINAANFSGAGLTPVSAYQYGLQWDPNVLQWISGPNVGPGTPTPPALLPCIQVLYSGLTPTPVPTGFVATYTPTFTPSPGPGTPSNTPTITLTPSMTPTPGGYMQVACFTLPPAVTPVANGVIGTFQFLPKVTGPRTTPFNLINVLATDFYGVSVVPMVTPFAGSVTFAKCYDLNGDLLVNILDLALLAAHYNTAPPNPLYVPALDVNSDGVINIIDLSLVATGYGLTC